MSGIGRAAAGGSGKCESTSAASSSSAIPKAAIGDVGDPRRFAAILASVTAEPAIFAADTELLAKCSASILPAA